MSTRLGDQAARIGALAEPVRRDLYAFVAAQPGPVSREQAADGVGVPLHTAKFHLDRLAREGLLEVEFRRLTGRTGPGAGRPTKLFRRSGREVSVSLPERHYDLLAHLLAAGVERARSGDVDVETAAGEAARDRGHASAASVRADGPGPDRAAAVLAEHGYEPAHRDDGLVLVNCPFDALAREHPELVCAINQWFVSGVLDGLDCHHDLEARLEPQDGTCCVQVRPVSG